MMEAKRQYIGVRFREGYTRLYTYHNDGEPVAPGDMVAVPDKSDGWKRVEVVAVSVPVPSFDTKEILGKVLGAAPGKGL